MPVNIREPFDKYVARRMKEEDECLAQVGQLAAIARNQEKIQNKEKKKKENRNKREFHIEHITTVLKSH